MKNNITIAFALSLILNVTPGMAAVSCELGSTGLFFGLINPLSSAEVTSIGTFNLSCTGGPVTYTIKLSQGNGTIAQRVMKSGLNELKYNLYTSNTYSTVLGDGTAGSLPINGISANDTTSATYYAYGKVSNVGLSGTVSAAYSDNISVTITY